MPVKRIALYVRLPTCTLLPEIVTSDVNACA
jgi:hypothetical protein